MNFGPAVIRRTIALLLFIVLVAYGTDYVLYHPDLRKQFVSFNTVGVVVIAFLAVAVLLWSAFKPTWWKVLLAFFLGMFAWANGSQLFGQNIAFFAIVSVGGIVLYLLTIVEEFPTGSYTLSGPRVTRS